MLMNEIFNSTVPVNWTNIDARTVKGMLTVDADEYEIIINAHDYKLVDKIHSILNVAFCKRQPNGICSFDLTNESKNAPKVLGAVINGIWKKVSQYHADAIVLAMTDNIDKRMPVYRLIAMQFVHQFGRLIEDIPIPNGKAIVLINKNVSKEDTDSFLEHIKTVNK